MPAASRTSSAAIITRGARDGFFLLVFALDLRFFLAGMGSGPAVAVTVAKSRLDYIEGIGGVSRRSRAGLSI
jgi:hypothetical protein